MDLEERMLKVEEATAIQGQKSVTHRNELNELYTMLRKHMVQVEADRLKLINLITSLENSIANQKSFVAGVTFTVSILWIVGIVVWNYFTK